MANERVWKEGVVAGVLGAGSVALWFLILDLIAGAPLATPALLGRTLFSVLGKGIDWTPSAYVAAYTIFHVVAFIAVGIIVRAVVEASESIPGVLAGLLLFFVIFEVGSYYITAFLSQPETMGRLSWWRVGVANLIAAVVMGWYLWHGHPELKSRFSRALVGQS